MTGLNNVHYTLLVLSAVTSCMRSTLLWTNCISRSDVNIMIHLHFPAQVRSTQKTEYPFVYVPKLCSISLVSTYVVCERLSVMHKQVCGWTVNFPESPFLEFQTRKPPPPPPPFRKTSDLRWPKFTPEYPPPFWKTSDLRWPKFTPEYPPHFGKLQIWDDQSLLRDTPPFRKTSDLRWPKLTPEYPPPFGKCVRSYVETNL